MPRSASVDVESNDESKGKTPLIGDGKEKKSGLKKVMGIMDFILRLAAIIAALVAAATMGTSNETAPFFSRLFHVQVSYGDLPTFRFFVIAMSILAAYLVLSLLFSVVTIIRPNIVFLRIILFIFDIVVLSLGTASAAAAAAIVYLAHSGNADTNWLSICQQFGDYCRKVNGAVVASFVDVVFLMLLVLLSGFIFLKRG
ncbi:casparian strip membrane protein 1-like [Hibiscus syriacus]|uniref:casparian strip membrane protein 1-like n=1 Tax=Hibiscus syriacus TaxID=106335 RepID=UPI0019233F09|nr:casparian strip membrane protein 1-like [Hibiscus syriacus]